MLPIISSARRRPSPIARPCVDNWDPSVMPVHYLVLGGGYTSYDDSTVYAEKDYDYSAWPTGLAGFDSRPGHGATAIPTGGKYWFRHEIVLASTSGVTFYYSVDDIVELWIDGVLAFSANPGGGTYTYAIPPSKLKVGCNHIAVSCKDIAPVNAFIYWHFEQV